MFWDTTLLVMCVFFLILWISKKRKAYPRPPSYPGALPIIGHAHMLLGSCEKIWESSKKFSDYSVEVGGLARVFVGPMTIYIVTDPDDFSTIMNKCLDKAFLYDFAKPWAGSGLITADVTSWKNNRKLFAPFFNQRAVNMYLDIFNSQSKLLVKQFKPKVGKGAFDHYHDVLENMLETIVQTTLGPGYDDGKNRIDSTYIYETDHLLDLYIVRLQRFWLQLPFFFNRSDIKKRQDEILEKIRAKTLAVIRKRKTELKYSEKAPLDQNNIWDTCKPLLDCILETFAESEGFTDNDIREHLETFILAAFDSTGRTVVFALNLIGAYPHVQERILKELNEVFGDTNRDVEKDDIPRLVYLEAVLRETLRVCATTPLVGRTNKSDFKLKNYTIPKGETFICSLYGINRHQAWGEDATEFKPERWLEDRRSPTAIFAGFSYGKRGCLGEIYAMTVMKTNLVHIFRHYHVSAKSTKLAVKYHVLLKPISGHYISLEFKS